MAMPVFAAADEAASLDTSVQPPTEVAAISNPVQSKFKLSVGGLGSTTPTTRSTLVLEVGGHPSGVIPAAGTTAASQNQSIMSINASRLWVKSSGPEFLGAKTSAIIESDFNGNYSAAAESPMVRLRLANAVLKWQSVELEFGQEWDIFGPMVAASIDFRNGTAWGTPNNQRVPQIRVTKKMDLNDDNAVRLVLGVQDPSQCGRQPIPGQGVWLLCPDNCIPNPGNGAYSGLRES